MRHMTHGNNDMGKMEESTYCKGIISQYRMILLIKEKICSFLFNAHFYSNIYELCWAFNFYCCHWVKRAQLLASILKSWQVIQHFSKPMVLTLRPDFSKLFEAFIEGFPVITRENIVPTFSQLISVAWTQGLIVSDHTAEQLSPSLSLV